MYTAKKEEPCHALGYDSSRMGYLTKGFLLLKRVRDWREFDQLFSLHVIAGMQGVSLWAKIRVEERRNKYMRARLRSRRSYVTLRSFPTDFRWNGRLLAVYVIKSLIKMFQAISIYKNKIWYLPLTTIIITIKREPFFPVKSKK